MLFKKRASLILLIAVLFFYFIPASGGEADLKTKELATAIITESYLQGYQSSSRINACKQEIEQVFELLLFNVRITKEKRMQIETLKEYLLDISEKSFELGFEDRINGTDSLPMILRGVDEIFNPQFK